MVMPRPQCGGAPTMLRALLLFVLAGCHGVGHRSPEVDPAPPIDQASVRFERGEGMTIGPRLTLLGTGTSADSVLELGGRVQLMTDDSIVIRPSYLILPDTAGRGRRTVRLQQQGFPMLAIVRRGPGVTVGPYRWPYPRAAIMTPQRLLGGLLLFWAYYRISTR